MGLEARGNNRYYYRKVRRGRRVVSEYVSGGDYAALLCAADTHIKAQQDAQRRAWQAERERIEAADELVNELGGVVHRLVVETFEAAGYHQHKRQWRKRRISHD